MASALGALGGAHGAIVDADDAGGVELLGERTVEQRGEIAHALVGARIVGCAVRKPVVLRCLADDIRGRIDAVTRRAHFVLFGLEAKELVVSPMLAAPPAFIAALAGLALFRVLQTAFTVSFRERHTFGALVSLVVMPVSVGVSAIAAMVSGRRSLGWGLVKRIRSIP